MSGPAEDSGPGTGSPARSDSGRLPPYVACGLLVAHHAWAVAERARRLGQLRVTRCDAPDFYDLATHRHNGRAWSREHEVTGGVRIRYVIDDQHRAV